MGRLDIYCREDIANALLAAEEASSATAAVMLDMVEDPARLRVYREGYCAALTTVALAFGLSPRDGDRRPEITFKATFDILSIEKRKELQERR